MRVLLIDQFSELGGAQRGLLEAAEGFAARGWGLHAAIPEGPLVERLQHLGSGVSVIPCGPYQSVTKTISDGFRFASQFRYQAAVIADIVGTQGIDVLYVNGPRPLPPAAWARRGRPLVFHSHSVVTQATAAALAGRSLRWADAHVLASSEFVASWLRPFVPQPRLHVVYNGIRKVPAPRTRGSYRRIGVLGRIAPEKGQLTFVRAARIAAESEPDLTFTIAGAPIFGSQAYMDQVRSEAGPRVSFLDWTENIGEFFAGIDILVVPSEAVDANPRVIPEAYSAGVPVIAFDSGGVGELLGHNETGILVKEHSARALAASMIDAVRNPQELDCMAEKGYQRWSERYTLPRFQSEVCDALTRAVDAREPLARARASAST
ncbi:MAG: glycosyltransferase family 4 protein [Bryobacteraceae bacterium]